MQIRGVVRTADLTESPTNPDEVEMILKVQGVGAGQPRTLVIPFPFLVENPSLDPDEVAGRGFEAEVEPDGPRHLVRKIAFASRVLRSPD